MELDQALQLVGAYGRYQILIWWLMATMDSWTASWHMLAMTFIGYEPAHHCKVPYNTSLPQTQYDGKWQAAQCLMYTNETATNDTEPCDDGWWYDTDVMKSSVVTEWDLVCEYNHLSETAQSVYMAGLFLGGCLMGMFSDRFGRKKVMFVGFAAEAIFGAAAAFVPNFYAFMVLRFIIGAFVVGANLTGFIVACELFPTKQRTIFGTFHEMQWSFGCCILPAIAFGLRRFGWPYIQLAISIPSLITFFSWRIVPESVPWLISKGRLTEAETILERAAKFNGRELPERCLHDDQSTEKDKPEGPTEILTPITLFKTPQLRRMTFCGSLFWFSNVVVYYGLSQDAPNLHGDIYLNFLLLSVVEVPSLVLSVLLMYKFGRRYPIGALYLFCGMACIALPFIPEKTDGGTSLTWLSTTIALVGKFCINAAFSMSMVYIVELFPTVIRATGFTFTNIFGRVGGVLYPYILYLHKRDELGAVREYLPYMLFGATAILASAQVLLLPETHGRTLPETIEDIESESAFQKEKHELKVDVVDKNGGPEMTEKSDGCWNVNGTDNLAFQMTKL